MAKYRKRPVVIEAEQWFPNVANTDVCWCALAGLDPNHVSLGLPHLHTLEGPMLVSPGDYIITGVMGERYPCKPNIFEATYDPAELAPTGIALTFPPGLMPEDE